MICAPAEGRLAFRAGAWDLNGRKYGEDSAADHIVDKSGVGVCAGEAGRHSLRVAKARSNTAGIFSAGSEMFREKVVIAPQ